MKKFALIAAAIMSAAAPAFALEGTLGIHDPSNIVFCEGKYYTFGTGNAALVSEDGWTWSAGTRPPGGGLAPDIIKLGDRYCLYIPDNRGGQPHSHNTMIWTKSLNPQSPDYKWSEPVEVTSTDGIEDCNGIDPGVFQDPNDGKVYITYGSYFGYIRVAQLDPKTGERIKPMDKPADVAINMEASTMIYQNGYYYLIGTRGSCCRGADSGYNLRVGRGKTPFGPFVDDQGVELLKGGGMLMASSQGSQIGPGHFGLIDIGDGVQKFSLHYEADLARGNTSGILDIRPLLWKDGWPIAGDDLSAGNYQIQSARTGTVLELAVQGQPVGGGGRGGRGGPGGGAPGGGRGAPGGAPRGGPGGAPGATGPMMDDALFNVAAPGGGGRGGRGGGGAPIPPQTAADVQATWPQGQVDVRLANYLLQAQQKWTVTPANAGGYMGAPYYKIAITGTDRVLAATAEGDLVAVPEFKSSPEQLWQIDQLTDGSYRIMPKEVPGSKERLALSAIGNSSVVLSKYDPNSLKQRWNFKAQ